MWGSRIPRAYSEKQGGGYLQNTASKKQYPCQIWYMNV